MFGYLQDMFSAGKGILAINQDIVTCFVVYVQRCIATCFSFEKSQSWQKILLISIATSVSLWMTMTMISMLWKTMTMRPSLTFASEQNPPCQQI